MRQAEPDQLIAKHASRTRRFNFAKSMNEYAPLEIEDAPLTQPTMHSRGDSVVGDLLQLDESINRPLAEKIAKYIQHHFEER